MQTCKYQQEKISLLLKNVKKLYLTWDLSSYLIKQWFKYFTACNKGKLYIVHLTFSLVANLKQYLQQQINYKKLLNKKQWNLFKDSNNFGFPFQQNREKFYLNKKTANWRTVTAETVSPAIISHYAAALPFIP